MRMGVGRRRPMVAGNRKEGGGEENEEEEEGKEYVPAVRSEGCGYVSAG